MVTVLRPPGSLQELKTNLLDPKLTSGLQGIGN